MRIELESIENLLAEYDINTKESIHTKEALFGILDEATENKVEKPDDFVEDIDDLEM